MKLLTLCLVFMGYSAGASTDGPYRTELVQEPTTWQDEQFALDLYQQEYQEYLAKEERAKELEGGDGGKDGPMPKPPSASASPSPTPSFPPLPPLNPGYGPGYGYGGGYGSVSTGIYQLDAVINLALRVWEIIQQGKPSFTATTNNANALPEGARSAWDLQGWAKTPKVAVYKIRFLNSFNAEVGHFAFRLIFTYGGSVMGKGRYLSSVKIVPYTVNVPWGCKLDAKVDVMNTVAIGDPRNPTAQMELMISHELSSWVRTLSGSQSFIVKGDGSYQELGGFSSLR